jgi:hypothetical protein
MLPALHRPYTGTRKGLLGRWFCPRPTAFVAAGSAAKLSGVLSVGDWLNTFPAIE